MKLKLIRIARNARQTYGVLLRNDGEKNSKPLFVTLEDPDLNNIPNESCIPVGTYLCQKIISPHFGEVFEVSNVENRTHILFHCGNSEADTHGCILLGQYFDFANDRIAGSRNAMYDFMKMLSRDDFFSLEIVSFCG